MKRAPDGVRIEQQRSPNMKIENGIFISLFPHGIMLRKKQTRKREAESSKHSHPPLFIFEETKKKWKFTKFALINVRSFGTNNYGWIIKLLNLAVKIPQGRRWGLIISLRGGFNYHACGMCKHSNPTRFLFLLQHPSSAPLSTPTHRVQHFIDFKLFMSESFIRTSSLIIQRIPSDTFPFTACLLKLLELEWKPLKGRFSDEFLESSSKSNKI